MKKEEVINGVSMWTIWWLRERKKKLKGIFADSMTVNPFLIPILMDIHNLDSFEKLNDLNVLSHLMIGHYTGFGKLIDEKILPNVFDTKKLDKTYRRSNPPLHLSCFDEIDHVINRRSGQVELLSLKASKWTIQLTMAVQLNKSFHEIIRKHGDHYSKIVVGVFYGKKETLTDKYDILRGINRGASHDVVDLKKYVFVHAGREFWSWLCEGENNAQEWVMQGILDGLAKSASREEWGALLSSFISEISKKYHKYLSQDGKINWHLLLKDING